MEDVELEMKRAERDFEAIETLQGKLQELNEHVAGSYVAEDISQVLDSRPDFLDSFNLLIATQLASKDVDRVANSGGTDDGVSREMRAFIAAEGVVANAKPDGRFEKTLREDASAPVADVVAALGAEREKCKELEWRLRRAETALDEAFA